MVTERLPSPAAMNECGVVFDDAAPIACLSPLPGWNFSYGIPISFKSCSTPAVSSAEREREKDVVALVSARAGEERKGRKEKRERKKENCAWRKKKKKKKKKKKEQEGERRTLVVADVVPTKPTETRHRTLVMGADDHRAAFAAKRRPSANFWVSGRGMAETGGRRTRC